MNIPKSIVVLGASTAYGKHDVEGGGFAGRLRRWHDEINSSSNSTFNLGISGDRVERMIERLDAEAAIRKPELIVLQLGNNDLARIGSAESDCYTSIQEFEVLVGKLLSSARELAPLIVIGSIPVIHEKTNPVSWREVYFREDDVFAYAQVIKALALRGGIEYIDMVAASEEGVFTDSHMSDDGLHMNSAGHEFVFEKIRDRILAMSEDAS